MPLVYAKEIGIHPTKHGRVRKGDEFEVPEGVTDDWFAPVVGKPVEEPVKKRAPKPLRDVTAEELA